MGKKTPQTVPKQSLDILLGGLKGAMILVSNTALTLVVDLAI